jgi:hypothetical protein
VEGLGIWGNGLVSQRKETHTATCIDLQGKATGDYEQRRLVAEAHAQPVLASQMPSLHRLTTKFKALVNALALKQKQKL